MKETTERTFIPSAGSQSSVSLSASGRIESPVVSRSRPNTFQADSGGAHDTNGTVSDCFCCVMILTTIPGDLGF
jgi:hypothetical protein